MHIKTFCGGYDDNFSYLLMENGKALLIDSALPAAQILEYVKKERIELVAVIILHSHYDHIVDLEKYTKEGMEIWAYENTELEVDNKTVDRKLEDNEIINFEGNKIKVLHTPGHRYDAICLLVEAKVENQTKKMLFTSDTLFVEAIGATHFEGSDPELMKKTLQRLKSLPDETIIYPGHDYGSTPTSTIGREKKENKFLK